VLLLLGAALLLLLGAAGTAAPGQQNATAAREIVPNSKPAACLRNLGDVN
jgi:hypothetical protein